MWTDVELTGLSVGLYTRISDDTEQDAKGVGRQEEDERAFVLWAGGVPAEPVYDENDTSAYRKKRIVLPDGTSAYRVIRPKWQRMLADLRAGVIQAACVYDIDRLARDPRDLEDAIELVEHYRRPIVGVTGGFDLMTDNGRFAARILVAQANKASADTARRVARKHVQLQQEGAPTGNTRPFGWEEDKRTVRPAEAEEIRRVVERIVAGGWPVAAVVVDLNDRGVLTSTGKRWRQTTLVQMLRNPRLAGLRARTVHEDDPVSGSRHRHLEIVRRPDGSPVVGQWDPILTVAEWEAVLAVVGTGTRAAPGRNSRHYLLTGICRCGECGSRMRGLSNASRPHQDTRNVPAFVYGCPSRAVGGCGGVTRNGPEVDAHVREAVFAKIELETSGAVAELPPWDRQADYDRVTADIAELTAAWKAQPKRISSARYFALLPDLEAAEKRLLADRARHAAAVEAAKARPANIRTEWPDYPLARQRAIVEEHLSAVVIHKAARKGARFDPDLLELVWTH
jgi:site-specific DNA recombinase